MAPRSKDRPKWLNPAVLRWARLWRGKTLEEAADKIGKSPAEIEAWEDKDSGSVPTVRQARLLADFYDRSFLELLLPEPPSVPEPSLIPDYRMHRGEEPPRLDRDIKLIQQWAQTQRDNALDLFAEIGEEPPLIPANLFTTITADAEEAAKASRKGLKFEFQEQLRLTRSEAEKLPDILRRKCEGVGILTLRRPDLKEFGVRGICLAVFPLPVIVFRGEAPSAQAFTLVHELAHILTRQSGITGPRGRQYRSNPIEGWADHFAGAFLMPADEIQRHAGRRPDRPAPDIDDDRLTILADTFKVSQHAMLIRLVHLGYVQPDYYWEVKKPLFDAAEREHKSFGRSKYYGSRYKNRFGNLYTGLVLEAWSLGRITNHNAAEYLGIKKLNHLRDIRDNFGGA